jgi:hypothetical protein
MPRLVLLEDDGRVIVSADVSRANFNRVRRFLRHNGGFIRWAAAGVRAVKGILGTPAPPRRIGGGRAGRRR